MLRLRPYKSADASVIASWVQDLDVFQKWGGEHIGEYPVDAQIINNKYLKENGGCIEEDNFYPWVAIDEDDNVVGHFIMRYLNGDMKQLRFGWVIVDSKIRGKGYGKNMLALGLKYAFEILSVDKITIGVYENNAGAYWCYRKVGFSDTHVVECSPENIIEMELLRENYC